MAVEKPQALHTSLGVPSEIWYRSVPCVISTAVQQWQEQQRRLGFDPRIARMTIEVTTDEDHPYKIRTVTVIGNVEKKD